MDNNFINPSANVNQPASASNPLNENNEPNTSSTLTTYSVTHPNGKDFIAIIKRVIFSIYDL